jgi:hypothetical protein
MSNEDRRSQTFVEWVLALLEERFPWLGKDNDEPVSGANTVDKLADLHRNLIDQRNANHVNSVAAPGKKHQSPRRPGDLNR